MKAVITFIAIFFALSAYSIKQGKTTGEASNIDMTIESTDAVGTQRTLNDIRFNGWERNDWLDNE